MEIPIFINEVYLNQERRCKINGLTIRDHISQRKLRNLSLNNLKRLYVSIVEDEVIWDVGAVIYSIHFMLCEHIVIHIHKGHITHHGLILVET